MNGDKLKIQNKASRRVGGRQARRAGGDRRARAVRAAGGVTIVNRPQSSSERAASMSDVGTLAAMDAFAGGARRRPARLPPPPPFVPPPPPQRHDHYYVRRKSPIPRHAPNLSLFARTHGTALAAPCTPSAARCSHGHRPRCAARRNVNVTLSSPLSHLISIMYKLLNIFKTVDLIMITKLCLIEVFFSANSFRKVISYS